MSLVRPQLEYGAEAWNPYTSGAAEGCRKQLLVLSTATTEDPHRPQGLSPTWDGINFTHVAS